MKKYLLLLVLAPLLLSSCFRYGYLKQNYMQGFNETTIREAQFYMDRKAKIKGKYRSEQNVVTNGEVTIVKTKNKDKIRIHKFTKGQVVSWTNNHLVVAFGSGNSSNLTFIPEKDKRGDVVYTLQTEGAKPLGGSKMEAITRFEGHELNVKFHKGGLTSFRLGKFSDKPSLVFKKRVRHARRKTKGTVEGRNV